MTSFKGIAHPTRSALLLAALALPGAASAQSRDHVTLGAGAGVVPDYQGSDDYRFLPVPVIDAQFGQFFVSLRNGIGVNIIETGPLTAGASVALVGGYRRRDVPDGVQRVSTTAGGRLFANLRFDQLSFTVGATKAVAGGTRGVVADASVSYALALSDRMTVIPTVGTSWANGKHMNRYFGIDAGEAIASGLPFYRAGSGFKDVSGLITARYRLDTHWSLGATGGVTRLLSDAADSPLNKRRWQPSGFMSVAYTF
ncbi:MipA/OmpV family protein [Sphingomonas sp. MJ1 (PH-R8)]|uniref:MipA/OmpV family protein n=1 Tax=Sphingomonas sp. MJ1 (PH-R8) TaxID=3112950 RepID=UPI003A855697